MSTVRESGQSEAASEDAPTSQAIGLDQFSSVQSFAEESKAGRQAMGNYIDHYSSVTV